MKTIILALDVNYLAHRAFHTTGALKWGGEQTGVTYGIFRDIISMQEQFGANRIAFCFDHGRSLRKEILPCYKKKRGIKKLSDEHKQAYSALEREIQNLKLMYLPYLGYENIFYQNGYEADDQIGAICQSKGPKEEIVIVSADKDLYQLLRPGVCMYNPHRKTIYTHKSFFQEWGVLSEHWPKIKSIAGCSTDEIPGVKGVGEKTACQFYSGFITDNHRLCKPISDWIMSDNYRLNLTLVTLPMEGTHKPKLVEDELNLRNWRKLTKRLGMKTLQDRIPGHGFHIPKTTLKRA